MNIYLFDNAVIVRQSYHITGMYLFKLFTTSMRYCVAAFDPSEETSQGARTLSTTTC